MILGIDAGNHEVKIMGPYGPTKFLSDIGEFRYRRLEQSFGVDDMVGEYLGRKFFAGTLAKYESEFVGSMMGDSKAHEDTLLRVLMAIHRYSDDPEVRIVVGQPIGKHTAIEKKKIKEMITGKHTLILNDIEKTFVVAEMEVAAEGAAAVLTVPVSGLVRSIDIGSGTINCATLLDYRYIDKDSFTLPFGANTTMSKDLKQMSRAIAAQAMKKWSRDDLVLLVGGFAEVILPYISQYFPNCRILKPQIRQEGKIISLHSVYGTAVGNYDIARKLYAKAS